MAWIAPVANADDAPPSVPPPDVYTGNASARAVSISVDRAALLPIPDVFNFIALDGASSYSTSTRQARSSLLFPGNGAILGPSLLCGTFGGMFPPQFKPILDQCLQYHYPLTVFADDFSPDGKTTGNVALGSPTDEISADAIGATAHAAEDSARTDAAVQDLRLLGVPGLGSVKLPLDLPGVTLDTSLATVDSATSRTLQTIVNGSLVSSAKTTLSGIHLVGGLIDIGAITSESKISDDGKGHRTSDATLVTTGVTVAGQPARITNNGLELSKLNQALPVTTDAINSLLKALNIKVSLLPTEKTIDKAGAAAANVGGLLIEFAQDVEGLPPVPGPLGDVDPNGVYTGTVQLAQTGVVGQATSFDADDLLGGDDGGGLVGGDLGGLIGDGSVVPIDNGSLPGSNALGPSTNHKNPSLIGTAVDNWGDRLGWLYLAVVFVVLGLCIAPRLTVPARFGRRS